MKCSSRSKIPLTFLRSTVEEVLAKPFVRASSSLFFSNDAEVFDEGHGLGSGTEFSISLAARNADRN